MDELDDVSARSRRFLTCQEFISFLDREPVDALEVVFLAMQTCGHERGRNENDHDDDEFIARSLSYSVLHGRCLMSAGLFCHRQKTSTGVCVWEFHCGSGVDEVFGFSHADAKSLSDELNKIDDALAVWHAKRQRLTTC